MASIPVVRRPTGTEETELRAQMLGIAIYDFSGLMKEALKLQSQIECLLRALIRKRSSDTFEFGLISHWRDSRIMEVESLSLEGKPIAKMTEDEPIERLRYHRFSRLEAKVQHQSQEEEAREVAALLAGIL